MIPYGKHSIVNTDIDAVIDVLKNHPITQGAKVKQFAASLAEYCQANHCVTTNSGSAALHVACLASGISDDDWVWTVPNSFVASANCAVQCGAKIDFVDIDPITRNIDVNLLESKLIEAKRTGKIPKAVIVVHFSGLSCEMSKIWELSQKFGFYVIEDAAHALGAFYKGCPVGSCQFSHMTILSFHPVKTITSAEGGAITCNDKTLATKLNLYANIGVTRDHSLFVNQNFEPWVYEQQVLGCNYRLSDVHAVLGLSQLDRIEEFVCARTQLANSYMNDLKSLPLKLPIVEAQSKSAWHLFVVEVVGHDRSEVFKRLREKGIGVNVHYIPIHTQPFYQQFGFDWGDFPVSEQYYRNAVTLPLFPNMSDIEYDKVVSSLHEVMD